MTEHTVGFVVKNENVNQNREVRSDTPWISLSHFKIIKM